MTDIDKAPEAELQETTQSEQYGSVEGALAGNFQIQPIESLKQAWEMLPGLKMTMWMAIIIYAVITGALEFILSFVFGYSMIGDDFSVMEAIASIISIFITGPLAAGLYMIVIRFSVGSRIEVGELFKHFDKTIPIFITWILFYIAVGLGLILLIVPGIYLLVCFSFAPMLVVEKGMSPMEALRTSRKVVHQQWFQTAGLWLLSTLVVFAGMLALLVGLIWAIPLSGLMLALVYRNIFGVSAQTLAD